MKAMGKLAITDSRAPDLDEQIRCRAYQLYEQRGKTAGYDLEDWLLAEFELKRTEPEVAAA